jgi:hypothetical protein
MASPVRPIMALVIMPIRPRIEGVTFSRPAGLDTLFARLAAAAGFLGAVSDRFGLWGPKEARHVAWGDMQHFFAYTATLNPWFPTQVIPAVGNFVKG